MRLVALSALLSRCYAAATLLRAPSDIGEDTGEETPCLRYADSDVVTFDAAIDEDTLTSFDFRRHCRASLTTLPSPPSLRHATLYFHAASRPHSTAIALDAHNSQRPLLYTSHFLCLSITVCTVLVMSIYNIVNLQFGVVLRLSYT